MKHILNGNKILFALVLYIIAILNTQSIFAQKNEYMQGEDPNIIITASNYHPQINEEVTFTLKYTAPEGLEPQHTDVHFLFDINEVKLGNITVIKQDKSQKMYFKKGDTEELKLVLKFNTKKIYHIAAKYGIIGGSNSVDIYVGGAFKESFEVKMLRERIERVKRNGDLVKGNEINQPNEIKQANEIGRDASIGLKENAEQHITPANEYEKSIEAELKQKNKILYNELKKEFDSLYGNSIKQKEVKKKNKR